MTNEWKDSPLYDYNYRKVAYVGYLCNGNSVWDLITMGVQVNVRTVNSWWDNLDGPDDKESVPEWYNIGCDMRERSMTLIYG